MTAARSGSVDAVRCPCAAITGSSSDFDLRNCLVDLGLAADEALSLSRTSNPKVVGSNPTGRACVSNRQNTSGTVKTPYFAAGSRSRAQDQSTTSSRQEPSQSAPKRLPTATENATGLRPADPDLAAVIDVWDRLPQAVRAGIVAMVKAASGEGSR